MRLLGKKWFMKHIILSNTACDLIVVSNVPNMKAFKFVSFIIQGIFSAIHLDVLISNESNII